MTALPALADEIAVARLAAHYGVSVRTIQRAIIAAGARPIMRGPGARLLPEDVRKVREHLRRPRLRT